MKLAQSAAYNNNKTRISLHDIIDAPEAHPAQILMKKRTSKP